MRADQTGLKLSLVASVAALALAATAAPALALAAPRVTIGAVITDPEQRGSFSVTAWTSDWENGITGVSAKIRQGDTVVTEVPALVRDDYGRFALPHSAALRLTEDGGTIPTLGRYTVDVTATVKTGATATRTNAGTLHFTLRPALTLETGVPSWQERSVRPQGKLTGVQPGSGDVVPIAGRTVDVSRTDGKGAATHAVTTGENGEYTAPAFPLTAPSGSFRAEFSEHSALVDGASKVDRALTEHQARQVDITATGDRTRVLPGEQATITGRALFGTDPAANTALRVRLIGKQLKPGNEPYETLVTTDADGRFTVRQTGLSDRRIEGWEARPVDPFLSGSVTGVLTHPTPGRITAGESSLGANGTVKVTGSFSSLHRDPEFHEAQPHALRIERSADGKTGWKSVGSGTGWAHPDSVFTLTGKVSAGGHFRVRHLEDDHFTDTVGPVFRLHRNETRIASVNANPEPVKKGATLTVTGIAGEKIGSTWKALGKKPVQLWFQANGSTKWSRVDHGTTDTVGRASFTATAVKDGTWNIRYYGSSTRFDSTASGDYVDVR
ncbi:hypothetical protein [Streptomyces sp. NPDC020965]|uniref:hypothetical protein n=1 Tax=Streptomyces sp. NPDC020965 TaxID=3365105 RepID=UPI0037A9BC06